MGQEKPAKSPKPNVKRLSLQPHYLETQTDALRKEKSHSFQNAKDPVFSPSSISVVMEKENSEDEQTLPRKKVSIVQVNERKHSKVGRTNNKELKRMNSIENTTKSTLVYENAAFEGNLKRTPSVGNVGSVFKPVSRAPSVQSLEVVREQYCCCAKRRKCERALLTVVTVMSVVIVVLIIVVIMLATDQNIEDIKKHIIKLQ